MKRPFRTRRATYPDDETAAALGDPNPPRRVSVSRGGTFDNRLWIKREGEALLLLAHVEATPDLAVILRANLDALARRKFFPPKPGSPHPIARASNAREARRRYFIGLFQMALPHYLASHPDAPAGFHDTPRYLSVAFRRLCVREHFRLTRGNPDSKPA